MAKKDVAKVDAGVPAELEDEFLEDVEEFEESLTQDDMAVPFLQVLQALSPQVTDGEDQFIEGAQKGQLFNTVSKECYNGKEGVTIVPVRYKHSFIEWVPREDGGGFVSEWSPEDRPDIHTSRNDRNQDIIVEGSPKGTSGNQIVDTATHYVLIVSDKGDPQPAVMSMSSTQFKVSRNWNSQISMRTVQTSKGKKRPPRFWDAWTLKSVLNKNDQGSWYGYDLTRQSETRELDNGVELMDAARAFARAIGAGEKSANYGKEETSDEPPF